MIEQIQFKLNGKSIKLNVDSERMLLWVLRTDLGLTGTKYGCGKSFCGACTIYDAIGARVKQLPMNPERIKEAMKG